MKSIKHIAILFLAFTIALGVNAQATAAKKETKTEAKGQAKPADKGTQPKTGGEKKAEAKPAEKKAAAGEKKAEKKPADGRTKTGDKINKELKGPNGETVYTGEKGGNYYLGKDDKKIYLKK
jgi:hypothetical protein